MSREDMLLDLESEMGVLIRRVRRVLGDRAAAVDPDVQVAGYTMMLFLQTNGPQRAATIASTYDIDKGAVSRQVTSLMSLGLIRSTPDPSDGRAQLLELTAKGQERLEAVTDMRRERLQQRLGDWSESDLSGFVSLLAKYNQSLDQGSTR